jgi:hypothetical protein
MPTNMHTCCIIWGNSEHRIFRPWSSNIFSNAISCRATKVVSSMSSPAWFAKVNTGVACKNRVSWRCFQTSIEQCNNQISYEFEINFKHTFRVQHSIASEWCHKDLSKDSFPSLLGLSSSAPKKHLKNKDIK